MNLSTISRNIVVTALFLIATIMLYVAYDKQYIPFILFMIGFGLVILTCVYIMIKPKTKEEWRDIPVFPVKRKK